MSNTQYDYDKLFLAYEECRSDNTAHFRKILELQKELAEKDAEIKKLKSDIHLLTKTNKITAYHVKEPINQHHVINMREQSKLIESLQSELKQVREIGVEMQREVNRKLSLQLDELKSELAEKDAVLEFYALPENWINYQAETWSRACPKSHGDEEMIRNYAHKNRDWNGTIVVGGKRAREVMAKFKKESV